MATIPSQTNFPTSRQVPDHAILDINGKQCYLGNQFLICTEPITVAVSTETPVIYISNPSNNTKSVFIYDMGFNTIATIDTAYFRLYKSSSGISSGTSITPFNCRLASGTSSTINALLMPTVVTKGTRIQTVPGNYTIYQSINDPMLILDPGQSLLITVQTATSTSFVAQLLYYEL